jgi:hypothetical protein
VDKDGQSFDDLHLRAGRLDRSGSEYLWWENVGIEPLKIARTKCRTYGPRRRRALIAARRDQTSLSAGA